MQNFKTEFYKEVSIGERKFYLYKISEEYDNTWHLSWISAYKEPSPESYNFVVESGAGITEERMMKQVLGYLAKVA